MLKTTDALTGIFLSPMRESVITGEYPDTIKITETLTSIFFESTFNIPKSLLKHWGNHGLLGERECVCCSPRLWMNRSSERVRLKESCPLLTLSNQIRPDVSFHAVVISRCFCVKLAFDMFPPLRVRAYPPLQ